MCKRVNILLSLLLYLIGIALIVVSIIYAVSFSLPLVLAFFIIPSIITGIIIFLTNRSHDVKLSWIMVILCLPGLGILLYWIFGKPYRYRKKQKVHLSFFHYFYQQEDWTFTDNIINNNNYNLETITCFKYTTRIAHRPLYKNTDVDILVNGPNKFIKLLTDLKAAKSYILINYFVISEGRLLDIILKILQKKVLNGVKVYIIYDHIGSYFNLSRKKIRAIKKMGIEMHRFAPIRLPLLTGIYNFRNHRKDIIIDGYIGYIGGINLADNYLHLSARYGFWRDTQVRIEGEAIKSLALIFLQDWQFITGKILKLPSVDYDFNKFKNNKIVQFIDDGPLTKETIQKDLFIKFITMAKKRVWISTPYLVPTSDLITVLRNSAYSGIDVRLCLPAITDKFLSLDLSRTYYDTLLEAGVKIYEYSHVFNHSKMGLFDDNYTVIGSTNLDYRSLYSDHQTLLFIYDQAINAELATNFCDDFSNSQLIEINPLVKRSKFYHKIFLPLFRILAPLF